MLGAFDGLVRPSREEVTSVNDDGVLNGSRVDEIAIGRKHLQAATLVLEELLHSVSEICRRGNQRLTRVIDP